METIGLYFYWCSWITWVITAFFMKKNKQRTFFLFGILIIIILANQNSMIASYHISTAFIILLGGCLILYSKVNSLIYNSFISFTIMVGYTAMLIWTNSTPLWIFIHELVLIPVFCSTLIIILSSNIFMRIKICILGMATGELLYNLILS